MIFAAATRLPSAFAHVVYSVFPSLTDDEWMAWARRAFREKAGGGLERTYDLKISHTLDGLDPSNPLQIGRAHV